MLFHSWEFWIFLLVVLPLFYTTPLRIGRFVLLAASYFFYMWWNPAFVLLIVASTVIDYLCGGAIPEARGARRKWLLIASLTTNLGLLGFFKYYNFFAGSVAGVLGISSDSLALQILLPVGISFYTFQSMSYTIDIYRGRLQPVKSFVDFALFVAFFPQLVAGPIVRAKEFLPQLHGWKKPTANEVQEGINLALFGLAKKMILADNFAIVSDAYFKNPAAQEGYLTAWSATLAFAMQIFFDFSGYTDIARGCAKLLGFHFPINFRRPYLAASIQDFWRRWHISLSTWLRDYLYISMGGNRLGTLRTYQNLIVTMLLGGLWHGASWNFVIWGGYHGVLLAITRRLGEYSIGKKLPRALFLVMHPLAVALNFFLVLLGWVFFRAQTFADSLLILGRMFNFQTPGEDLLGPGLWLLVLFSFATAILEERYQVCQRLIAAPIMIRLAFYLFMFVALDILSVTGAQIPFVYFQF